MPPSRSSRFAWLLLGLIALAGAGVLFFFDPAAHAFYPACPLHAVTGLDCPACGGLRAAHLLLHGRVRDAYALNPFLFWALPVGGLFLVTPALRRAKWLPWAALAVLTAVFIWRNWMAGT